MKWEETDSYLLGLYNGLDGTPSKPRIAAFDLDDTLIVRPKGKQEDTKWQLLSETVSEVIAHLVEENYLIVVFTNQAGMTVNKNFDIESWKKNIKKISKNIFHEVPDRKYYFAVLVAKKYDLYRKPNIGLWHLMEGLVGNKISRRSFFCGDAAGRTEHDVYNKKKDFSDTDRKFALNIGLKFYTPDDIFARNFQVKNIEYELTGIHPETVLSELKKEKFDYQFKPIQKEMILMVGFPGSGKSEFVRKYILPSKMYVHVNQDTCKTKAKCVQLTRDALSEGKSVVIDNTNLDPVSRTTYINLAIEFKYKHIRCIELEMDIELAKHLNNVRHIYSRGKITKISPIAYRMMKSKYIKPDKQEGFDKMEIIRDYFNKEKLKNEKWKTAFMLLSED